MDVVERCALLALTGICSPRCAAKVYQVEYGQVRRAIKAIKDGRDVGKQGMPPFLNDLEEHRLLQLEVECLAKGVHHTISEICDEVSLVAILI